MASRDVRLRKTYNLSVEQYNAMLAAQGGVCAICRGKRRGNLDVDHDHAFERTLRAQGVDDLEATRRSVRGLLCKRCNRRLLPAAQDDREILWRGWCYLGDAMLGTTDAQQALLRTA